MKCLLQYKKHINKNGKVCFRRIFLNDDQNKDELGFNIWQTDDGWSSHMFSQKFMSLEAAMKHLDEFLIKNGWVLVPEGKEDIYKVLI